MRQAKVFPQAPTEVIALAVEVGPQTHQWQSIKEMSRLETRKVKR